MKKTYKLEGLECAHCAAKMEAEIAKLDGVISARVNYLAEKLIIEADEGRLDVIAEAASKICSKIEPECRVVR
jgi:copper chaperone CopZ